MARAGEVIEDLNAGARVRFSKTAGDTNGELLRFECSLGPHAAPPGGCIPHVHPRQTECKEVLSGMLRIILGGRRRILGPAEVLEVVPTTAHDFRNGREEETRVLVEFYPALRRKKPLVPSSPSV